MKTLTVFGIIVAIILIGLSVYVLEDLPAYGDEDSPVNKHIKLFSIADRGLSQELNESILPNEIKDKIHELGFVEGSIFPGAQTENYPSLDEGNYEIVWVSNGTLKYPWFYSEGGWDVFIKEGEIYYQEPLKWYFISEVDKNGNLSVYRYNWPIRVMEMTEEETGMGNAVTSGLADYRGYDTMGEETVILTGAIGVILLLRRRGRL
ncbi:MAG: hypothetical protein LUQ47_06220 [Methanotrichaceae archaeon]|nr:hypothetical protein [Methanotrichaceae archaeon]